MDRSIEAMALAADIVSHQATAISATDVSIAAVISGEDYPDRDIPF